MQAKTQAYKEIPVSGRLKLKNYRAIGDMIDTLLDLPQTPAVEAAIDILYSARTRILRTGFHNLREIPLIRLPKAVEEPIMTRTQQPEHSQHHHRHYLLEHLPLAAITFGAGGTE